MCTLKIFVLWIYLIIVIDILQKELYRSLNRLRAKSTNPRLCRNIFITNGELSNTQITGTKTSTADHILWWEETLINTHMQQNVTDNYLIKCTKTPKSCWENSNKSTKKPLLLRFLLREVREKKRQREMKTEEGVSKNKSYPQISYFWDLWEAPGTSLEEVDKFKWKNLIRLGSRKSRVGLSDRCQRVQGGSHTALRWYSGGATS